jgi:hypothetical protein
MGRNIFQADAPGHDQTVGKVVHEEVEAGAAFDLYQTLRREEGDIDGGIADHLHAALNSARP